MKGRIVKTPQLATRTEMSNHNDKPVKHKMTEAGMERYIATRDQHLHKIATTLDKFRAEVVELPDLKDSVAALRATRAQLRTLMSKHKALVVTYQEFLNRTNTDESHKDTETLAATLENHKKRFEQGLATLASLLPDDDDDPSSHASTTTSTRRSVTSSRASSARSARAKVEAAKARLNVTMKEVEVRKKRAALDAELDILKDEKELAAAEAEADVLENASACESLPDLPDENAGQRTLEYVNEHSRDEPPTKQITQSLNPSAPSFSPSQAPDWTTLLLRKELLLTRLTNFNDKPEAFMSWKDTFCQIVAKLNLSPVEELDLLVKWLGPESASQATSIKLASHGNPATALRHIWDRLHERYGAPELVEASLKAKLAAFPRITYKDTNKLYELADILAEVEAMKRDPRYGALLSYFDTSAGVNPIVAKLPPGMQEKWTSHAVKHNDLHGTYFPPFSTFKDFIITQSKIRNNPCFRYEPPPTANLTPVTSKKPKSPSRPVREHVLTRKTGVDNNSPSQGTKDQRCPIHNTLHSLMECKGFRAKPISERRQLLKKIGGCFKCCQLGHTQVNCTAVVQCECGSNNHHTALHDDGEEAQKKAKQAKSDVQPQEEPVNSKCTYICGQGVGKSCAKILPVKVFSTHDPANIVRVYAILDDQSNRSLARPELFNHLGIKGHETEYTLTSCNGQSRVTGRVAHDLVVESLGGTCHKLPAILECNDIPNSRGEIPTPEVAHHYRHLHDIKDLINPLDEQAGILLLLGRDIPEAHHVLDQRTGPRGTPFAQRLGLGWVLVGESCLGKVHKPDVVAMKTAVSVLPTGRPTLFTPCRNTIEVSSLDDIFATTKRDDEPGLSIEDHEFVELMDQEFHRGEDGNWVGPLPFRKGRPRLPNNMPQAENRAKTLDYNLKKNPLKKEHFLAFMGDILNSGYAERAPPLEQGEECWYLPLFGVYHPKKPDQLRGVFDASAQFDGISLNNVLLTGPDLTNNLLEILIRFRREPIAIVADIRKMFYGFQVQEGHRNFLRFLWYADNNPDNPLIEYRMCVHVFGNCSSPAVATYGLRKIAQQEEQRLGSDMKNFVTQDFYVDDALSSLPTPGEAIDLLCRTQQALDEGGNLKLHKIASNDEQVMAAFPQEDLAKDLRGVDLSQTPAPLQRTLGVSWNIQTDAFTFCVDEHETANTRRGFLATVNSIYDPLGFAAPVTLQGKLLLREVTETGAS